MKSWAIASSARWRTIHPARLTSGCAKTLRRGHRPRRSRPVTGKAARRGSRGRSALRDLAADGRRHFGAQHLDVAHDPAVLDGADAGLQQQALVAEDRVRNQYLLVDLLGRAHEVGPTQRARRLELLARDGRPA